MGTIRVLLMDISEIFLKGLAEVLASETDIEVVAICTTLQEGLVKTIEFKPDIIVCGMNMGITDKKEVMELSQSISLYMRSLVPDARTIVLTESEDEEMFFFSLRCGSRAYLSKHITGENLVLTIRRVHAGELIISPVMAVKLIKGFRNLFSIKEVSQAEDFRLTPREIEILKLAAHGVSNKEIGRILIISENTVKRHVSGILRKLQVYNRQQAAMKALHKGIVHEELDLIYSPKRPMS